MIQPLEKLQDKRDQCSSLPQIGVCSAMHCMHTDGIFLGLGKNYPNAKSLSKSVIFVTKLCQYNQDTIPNSGITVSLAATTACLKVPPSTLFALQAKFFFLPLLEGGLQASQWLWHLLYVSFRSPSLFYRVWYACY